jgi:hypothetical protein
VSSFYFYFHIGAIRLTARVFCLFTGHHAGGGYNSHGYGHGGTMGGGTHGGTRGGTQGGGSRGTQGGGGGGSYMVPVTFVAYAEVEIDEDEGYGGD